MFRNIRNAAAAALCFDRTSQTIRGHTSPLINPATPKSIAIINGANSTIYDKGAIAPLGVNYHVYRDTTAIISRY